jgi:hypothetical protein
MCAGFWWRNLKERHNFEDLGVDWIILKRIFGKYDGVLGTEFIQLGIGSSGGGLL